MKKIFPLLLIASMVYLYAKTYTEKLFFSVNSVKLDSLATIQSGFTKIYLITNLAIQNNNALPLYVKSYQADFYYSGNKVGSIVSDKELKITKGETVSGNEIVTIDTFSAIPAVASLLQAIKNNAPVNFEIRGVVDTSLFGKVAITKTVDLT